MKVAIVHDYLTKLGGAERVLSAIAEIWPHAPIYTSVLDKTVVSASSIFADREIKATPLQNLPLKKELNKIIVPFLPFAFENLDLAEYDVVISSGYFAKGVLTKPHQLHVNYCNTPPRFLYHYGTETKVRDNAVGRLLIGPVDHKLRIWDYTSAHRPDLIVANSVTVAERIEKFWQRNARVIYPPVELPEEYPSEDALKARWKDQNGQFSLAIGRLEPYKNTKLIVETCNKLEKFLKVAGVGSELKELKKIAGPTVDVMGRVPEEDLPLLYAGCKALVVAAEEEDFGLTPVEAMAYGKPIIALRSGGYRETVVDSKTGIFFDELSVESLGTAMEKIDSFYCRPEDALSRAREFSKDRFQEQFKSLVESAWEEDKNYK